MPETPIHHVYHIDNVIPLVVQINTMLTSRLQSAICKIIFNIGLMNHKLFSCGITSLQPQTDQLPCAQNAHPPLSEWKTRDWVGVLWSIQIMVMCEPHTVRLAFEEQSFPRIQGYKNVISPSLLKAWDTKKLQCNSIQKWKNKTNRLISIVFKYTYYKKCCMWYCLNIHNKKSNIYINNYF